MGSQIFDGVRFSAYPLDHFPAHVHGIYAGTRVTLELDLAGRIVRLARRKDRVTPANAKRSDVNHIAQVAGEHFDAIAALWKAAH